MIVDSSALIAILFSEPEADRCLEVLLGSPSVRLSAANFLEASIIVDRLSNPSDVRSFDALLVDLNVIIEPVTPEQARIARDAHGRFGRGTGHPAKLNVGDCFAYALASDFDEPLLFVVRDFVHTDIRPALG
ncbi:MAG: type II toxin-antitoxin system VapC family toxin [Thermomicrobiales bacterium]|nr:type II toxin-antitoxin system VapC family toxin [Thermomicrobiales bacterium]